jgi:hypothetical protein
MITKIEIEFNDEQKLDFNAVESKDGFCIVTECTHKERDIMYPIDSIKYVVVDRYDVRT